MPPNRANDSGNWKARAFGKQKYLGECEKLLWVQKRELQKVTELPIPCARFAAKCEVTKPYDCDNLAAILKWPLDALVYFGILKSDGPTKLWPKDNQWPVQLSTKAALRNLYLTIFPVRSI
jgi:hypothetical protein